MWHYLLYFLIGGAVVVTVSYIGRNVNSTLAAFVAGLPILTALNIFLLYRSGGIDASLSYARCALLLLPAFALYVALVIWLLPRLGMPYALAPGLPIFLVPLAIARIIGRRITSLPKKRVGLVNSSGVIMRNNASLGGKSFKV